MSYPLSSDVSAGQPTAADHYNNLRADALRLGQANADAVNLGTILAQFQYNVNLAYLATNRLRLTATPQNPVHVVVDGIMLSAVSNVDLPMGSTPSGAAMTYYVFAVETPGLTTFTLDINSSPGNYTAHRKIGSFYWDGSAIVRASIRTDFQDMINTLLPLQSQLALPCNGRLTLTSGTPVTQVDVASSGVLYFTPYNGSKVALYTPGFGWTNYIFTEVSLSLAAVNANTNYDVFLYDYLGTLTLYLEAWGADTVRSVALVLQDGVLVRSGQTYKRYLGTIRGSGANVCADTLTQRFVWNQYNQEARRLFITEATGHTYTGSTAIRGWNNKADATDEIYFVLGQKTLVYAKLNSTIYLSATQYNVLTWLMIDGIVTFFANIFNKVFATTIQTMVTDMGLDFVDIGFHFLQIAEAVTNTGATGNFTNVYLSGWLMG